mmetsp:Transcript_12701/g.42955  ORF Transcript_12701/g.42955 Transcript_12701/m.42955 type:complete len:212 (+) Transcript_12701:1-636(+)
MEQRPPSRAVVEFVNTAFEEADEDRSGELSVEELIQWVRSRPELMAKLGSTEDALRSAFFLYDKNGDASLDKQEFTWLLRKTTDAVSLMDSDMHNKATAIVDEIFDLVDADGNGTLELEEFRSWLNNNPESSSAILYRETRGKGVQTASFNARAIHVYDDPVGDEPRASRASGPSAMERASHSTMSLTAPGQSRQVLSIKASSRSQSARRR